jgi:prepilin-type N-terminal cleavage/methylation domain-containing protein
MSGQRGVTLVEALVALAILGIALTGVLPAFTTQTRANTRSHERASAVSAAQQIVEALRFEDPSALPSVGATAPRLVTVGDLQFDVVTRFCVEPGFCNDDSRHLTVEVQREGRLIYDVQTVYTRLH